LAGEPIDPLPVVPPEGLSRLRGAVLGHAIGDMAGQPVEILKLKEIKSQYGEIDGLVTYRHQTLPTGEYTDDTDMIWMELELMQDGRLDPWRLSEAFARRVSQIDLGQDLPRHYGQGTLMSMRRLGLGVNWRNTGNDSPKNGAAIRALPIAWSEFGDREKLLQMTESLSSLTHTGERALAGAKLVVLVMDYLLRKGRLDSDGLLSEISASIHEPRVSASLDVVKELIRYEASPEEAQARLGTSSKCEESVAYALYCFLRFPDDFRAVMRAAINVDGDSDSIAAVAGSFSGALLGEDAIPAEWKNRLSLKEEINQVLNSLAGHQG
jgi:ADP-ribosylglycohydrolase